jgi:hypothetical protein
MGFEMSNDGGDGGGGSGSGGSDGVNAYGAAPPPSQLGDFAVPNALGGQAQPMILTKAGNAEVLSIPDAFSSSVESGASSNYARMFVQDYVRTFTGRWPLLRATTALGGITQELRLGAVPGATGLTAEPEKLTKPGSLGYLSPTAGTAESPSAEGQARTDKLFDSSSGIYSYTTGKHFTSSESHLGIRAGGDIIIAAGVAQTDNDKGGVGKDLDLSAIGDIRLWAGGKVQQYAKGDSTNYYHGIRKTTVIGTNESIVYGDNISRTLTNTDTGVAGNRKTYVDANQFTEINGDSTSTTRGNSDSKTFGNRKNHVVGNSQDIFIGSRLNFSMSASANFAIAVQININLTFSFAFNYAFTMSYNLGISSSVFLSGRTTNITGTDLKFVVGLDAKKVDLALDLKGVDLSTKFTQAQKDDVKAWQAGIEAGNGNLSAEATAALKVFL